MNFYLGRLRSSRLASPDVCFPLILVLVGMLFFYDPLFGGKSFYFRDILNFHYPLQRYLIETLSNWQLPLWNPGVFFGQPMLANPNYMAVYPTSLLHLILPFHYAFKLHFVIHPILGGLGLFFLQRRLGITPVAAFGGSLAYQFSGTVLSFLNLYNILPAVALLPWIGWSYYGALQRGTWKRCIVLGLILGLQFIASEPTVMHGVLILMAGLALLFVHQSENRLQATGRALRTACIACLYGLLIAAIQVIPTLELMPLTARAGGYTYESVSTWSTPPVDWLNLAIPNLFGSMYTIDWSTYWGELYHNSRGVYLVSYFIGSVSLLLAALSLLSGKRSQQLTFAAIGSVGALLALGEYNPLHRWLFDHVPSFSLGRYPCKYFLLTVLALSVLVGLGLDFLGRLMPAERKAPARLWWVLLLSFITSLVLLSMWIYCLNHPAGLEEFVRSRIMPNRLHTKDIPQICNHLLESLRSSSVFLFLAAGLAALAARRRLKSNAELLLCALLGLELLPANLQLCPLIPDSDLGFVAEVNHYLKSLPGQHVTRVQSTTLMDPPMGVRLYAPNRSYAWTTLFNRMSGQPPHGILEGIQYSVDYSVDGLNTRDSQELYHAWSMFPEKLRISLLAKINTPIVLAPGTVRDPGIERMATFQTNSNFPVSVYRLRESAPRAYFVGGVERAADHKDALLKFLDPRFPYRQQVILEEPGGALVQGAQSTGDVKITHYESRKVVCSVGAETAGYMVLLDSYYPGWRAEIDGRRAEILRANYAFRAVQVTPGKHRVTFYYQPWTFYLGCVISCLALMGGLIALVCPFFPRARFPRARGAPDGA